MIWLHLIYHFLLLLLLNAALNLTHLPFQRDKWDKKAIIQFEQINDKKRSFFEMRNQMKALKKIRTSTTRHVYVYVLYIWYLAIEYIYKLTVDWASAHLQIDWIGGVP